MSDERITVQPPELGLPEPQPNPLPDFKLPQKSRAPEVLAYIVLALLVPVILCSGLLTFPANPPYVEYFRPINEFFARVMWCGIGLFVGIAVGLAVGKASR